MAYASVDDWLRSEEAQSHIGDIDGDGEVDPDKIADAIENASSEMDGWLAGRYRVPVTDPAAASVLRVHALYIATYHLARTSNSNTEEITDRYKASIKYLEKVAEGKAQLPETPVADEATSATSGDVQMIAPNRVFTRNEFEGW